MYNHPLLFFSLLQEIDNSFYNLNRKIFFDKINQLRNIELQNEICTNNNNVTNVESNYINFKSIFDYLKKMNAKKYNLNKNLKLNFDKDILNSRYKLYNLISNNFYKMNSNLSIDQKQCLKDFVKNKPFKILNCDKNVGTILISNSLFLKLSNEHLFMINSPYIKLEFDPLNNAIENINSILNDLLDNDHICNKLHKYMYIKNIEDVKLGSFKILPKIHKKKFGIRPIINCINHPTSNICLFVDLILQPFISKIDTILKDSQNLIQKCNSSFNSLFNSKIFLYSCDFESLYTNIKPNHATDLICEFISKYLINNVNISLFGFKSLLDLIFSNNYFTFEKEFFQQTIGIPMGCKCGPSIANLYLYILEKSWLVIHKPLVYGRFIDDIFYASTTSLDKKAFCNHFIYLKLNIIEGDMVNFLDLYISFDYITEKFSFNLYIKPTNTFSYLLNSSNHPRHIFSNIPKSLFIRLRRICSSYSDFLFHSRNLIIQLCKREYDPIKTIQTCRLISNIDRETLIPYKSKNNENYLKNNVPFVFTYDNSFPNLNNCISICTKNLYKNFSIKPICKINNNLNSLLIHNKPLPSFNFTTKKCNTINCKTCNYINLKSSIKIKNFVLSVRCDANCDSSGVIYIISCSKCNCFYIGESSKSAKERIYQHIYSINHFSKYLDKSLSKFDSIPPVAIHFAQSNHTLDTDFNFLIFQKDVNKEEDRKSIEADLINMFVNLNQTVLNKHIPSTFIIKKLCFD